MTAEPDLLPLPEKWTAYAFMTQGEMMDVLHDYARACVAHATAAKDAEVEALRAEVAAAIGEAMQSRADAKEWQGAAEIYRDRAERLAEALWVARDYVASELAREREAFKGYEHASDIASIEADLAKIDAALEQENDDA